MLTELPKVGQLVKALITEGWYETDNDEESTYQHSGSVYKIVGVSDTSGCPYFIGELDEEIYIDEESFYMYELHNKNNSSNAPVLQSKSTEHWHLELEGMSAYMEVGNNFNTGTFDLSFKFGVHSKDTQEMMNKFKQDVEELIKNKYN